MSGLKPFNWAQVERIFLASRPDVCPYLPGRKEQKLVTLLHQGDHAGFAKLSNKGFRRSHDAAYVPACAGCQACKALRVRVADFRPNKTQRRVLRAHDDLRLTLAKPPLSADHWRLFQAYVQGRHGDGSMASMTSRDFTAMVSDSPVKTELLEWRLDDEGPLIAACLTDFLPDGPSAVYSYFSLDKAYPSLGTFIILALIELAAKAGLPFVHLGYWVEGSAKMDYKANFRPAEICTNGTWQALPNSRPAP